MQIQEILEVITNTTGIPAKDLAPEMDLTTHPKVGKVNFIYVIYSIESKFKIYFPNDPSPYNTPLSILEFMKQKKIIRDERTS